jgi:hypothetical protein
LCPQCSGTSGKPGAGAPTPARETSDRFIQSRSGFFRKPPYVVDAWAAPELPRMHSFSNQINLPTVDDASLINMNNEAVYLLTISAANF